MSFRYSHILSTYLSFVICFLCSDFIPVEVSIYTFGSSVETETWHATCGVFSSQSKCFMFALITFLSLYVFLQRTIFNNKESDHIPNIFLLCICRFHCQCIYIHHLDNFLRWFRKDCSYTLDILGIRGTQSCICRIFHLRILFCRYTYLEFPRIVNLNFHFGNSCNPKGKYVLDHLSYILRDSGKYVF